jgi:uncharacterized membrane protein YgdD (TMEM256/DUF423 family)
MFKLGAWAAALAVVLGAFGAHALQDLLLATGRQDTFETAARYQMYHGLALVVLGLAGERLHANVRTGVALLFGVGIVLFSGSLYALCLLQLPVLGAITPLGGACFIAGWVWLALRAGIKN